mmetsp:Transcript_28237/g.60890  ORF Transcript_28237/g.60890 Transcript_28237/m.60890 type:complete len:166 (+) Transcript_28237:1-498(+)
MQQQMQMQMHQQPQQAPEPVEDAFTLLSQGRISDAVVRVLEDKDIAGTVALLELLTPQQVNTHCSHLERLCVVQQLAADMSTSTPAEGLGKRVDWVKNLVLSLLTPSGAADGAASDPHYAEHFKDMIHVVYESIGAAKILAQEGGQGQGVSTDLQLLEFVIQSKM